MIRKMPRQLAHARQTETNVGATYVVPDCSIGLWNTLMIDLGYVALAVTIGVVLFGEISWKGSTLFKGLLAR